MQRQIFQKKLREAEQALGFDFSEDAESDEEQGPIKELPSTKGESTFKSEESKLVIPDYRQFFETSTKFDTFQVYYTAPKNSDSPMFVFHHGAGSSGMTFALLVDNLRTQFANKHKSISPGYLVFDSRGHGSSESKDGDFSKDAMTKDFAFIMESFLSSVSIFDKTKNTKLPPIILVGHSLGGAIMTQFLYDYGNLPDFKSNTNASLFKGLVLLDIVEDTAVKSLVHMNKFLAQRPKGFRDLQTGIQWHLKERFLRNKESANISVPFLLKDNPDKTSVFKTVWNCDLNKTEPYWKTWFSQLSAKFVNAPVGSKLLLLAGDDSLDKELTIAQMQGKYQLIVFGSTSSDCGHFVHEDLPKKTAIALMDYWERYMQPKNGGIEIKWGKMRD